MDAYEKDAYDFAAKIKFPVPVKKLPVLLNFFPVNFRRELLQK
jgi:hypothetical protein